MGKLRITATALDQFVTRNRTSLRPTRRGLADNERRRLIRRMRSLEQQNRLLRAENEHLRDIALVDPLTELANRRGFETALDRELRLAWRSTHLVSLLLIDLDGMKHANDKYGHPAGDEVLKAVGAMIKRCLRQSDTSARLGGDEFAVIMPATDLDGAHLVAERIRHAICELKLYGISASVGVACCAGEANVPRVRNELIDRADAALYTAKACGKNCVVVGARPA